MQCRVLVYLGFAQIYRYLGVTKEQNSLSTQLIAHGPDRLALDGGRPHVRHPRHGPHHPEHPDLETEEGGQIKTTELLNYCHKNATQPPSPSPSLLQSIVQAAQLLAISPQYMGHSTQYTCITGGRPS